MRAFNGMSGIPGIVIAVGIVLGLTVTVGSAGDSEEYSHGIVPAWALSQNAPFVYQTLNQNSSTDIDSGTCQDNPSFRKWLSDSMFWLT